MNPQRYQQVKAIFAEASALPPPQRAGCLDRACGDDVELRLEVESLLAHDEKSLPIEPQVSPDAALAYLAARAADESSANTELHPVMAQPPREIGHYRIVREIGRGGMGVVYEAQQEKPRRTIALKVIRPGILSEQLLQRFELEAQVLGRLQHPGIAQVYEAGTAKVETAGGAAVDQPFFAMEYVRGETLSEFISQRKPGTRARLELFAAICEAIQHAHQKGVVHRDLKPGNILVDEQGQPKILDFGVALTTDADVQVTTVHTDVGQLIGTLPYMSPEQVAGDSRDIDTRSDVYALGVLCYQILTARLPYELQNKTIPEAARTIAEQDPTPLSSVNRVFRGDLEAIVLKALEKDKARRYQSASDLVADIRRYLSNEPISARPITTFYQFRKFARRNRSLVAGVLAVFLTLVIGVVGTTSQAVRVTRERNRARDAEHLAEQRRATAETEAAKAEAVSGFLLRMLRAVDPSVAQGYDVALLRLLLDDAAGQIDGELAEQPEVRATIQDTIGSVYNNIGARDEAEPHLEAAYELRCHMLGADDPETLSSLGHLCELRWGQDRYDEAESLCREVIEARNRVLGEHHPDTLSARYDLAGILRERGQIDEAEVELRAVLDAMRTHLGDDAPTTIQALNGLGIILRERGLYEEAIEHFRTVLTAWTAQRGEHHPSTLAVLQNLSGALREHGALDEAETMQRKAMALADTVYGPDHPQTIQLAVNFVSMLIPRGQAAEAEEVARDALARSTRVNGSEHSDTLKAMSNLGIALRMQGKLDESLTYLVAAAGLSRTILGEHAPARLNQLNSLAGTYYRLGRLAEAEEIIREVVAGRAAQYGEGHFETLMAMTNLGSLLMEQKKLSDAESLLSDVIERCEKAAPPGHWFRWATKCTYGQCLLRLDRYADAETVLVDAYNGFVETLGDGHPRTQETVGYLVRLYDAWGKPDQSAVWRSRLPTTQPTQ